MASGLLSMACTPSETAVRSRRPVYAGHARVDPAAGSVTARWRIRFVVDSTTTGGASLLLNRRLGITEITGEGVADFSSGPWREGSDFERIDVTWIRPAEPGEVRELRVAYAGVLYDSVASDPINDISPDWIELALDSGWQPVFASFAQSLVGDLTLEVPPDWTVVASGTVSRNGDVHVIHNRVPQIDFAFVAAPGLKHSGPPDVLVYHQSAADSTVAKVVEVATTCRNWLTRRFGSLPDLKFVLAPREEGGYARKNYIVLTQVEGYSPSALSRFVCHELAHYWSSHSSPSTADYWMTESFAELVSALHVRDVYGDTAYAAIREQWRDQASELPPVWTDTSTQRGSFAVNYRKGPLLLSELKARIAAPTFEEFLRRYMTEATRTTTQLLDQLEAVGGPQMRRRFQEALAEGS